VGRALVGLAVGGPHRQNYRSWLVWTPKRVFSHHDWIFNWSDLWHLFNPRLDFERKWAEEQALSKVEHSRQKYFSLFNPEDLRSEHR
jgi:hypothetical protein